MKYKLIIILFSSLIFFVSCEDTAVTPNEEVKFIGDGRLAKVILHSDSTYYFGGEMVEIDSLIIERGAIVKIREALVVRYIEAIGTEDKPIIFTSRYDNENGLEVENNEYLSPSRGDWKYIDIKSGNLQHCIIQYSKFGISPSEIYNPLLIENCQFSNNGGGLDSPYGVAISDEFLTDTPKEHNITIRNCNFSDNYLPLQISPNFDVDASNEFSSNDANYIFFSGFIESYSEDILLRNVGIPYLIWSIKSRGRLTIEQGVDIQLFKTLDFNSIRAVGTAEEPISFSLSSFQHLQNINFRNLPQEDTWCGIRVNGIDTTIVSELKHCNFTNMGNPNGLSSINGINVISSKIEIEYCNFNNCNGIIQNIDEVKLNGVLILSNPSKHTIIRNNSFSNCSVPITLKGDIVFSIDESNSFTENLYNFIFIPPNSGIETEIVGNITISEPNIPIVTTIDIVINEGNSLTLNNCIFKFISGRGISYNGDNLHMIGEVFFTSYMDDTKGGDSNEDLYYTKPGPCSWNGIFNVNTGLYCEWDNILFADCN